MPELATRTRLPDERQSITHHFVIYSNEYGEVDGYLTVGMFDNGNPGELFLRCGHEGEAIGSLLDAWATAVSIGLQSGIQLETFTDKFSHWKFEPCGMTRNENIHFASSVLDYVSRWLTLRFQGSGQDASEQGADGPEVPGATLGSCQPEAGIQAGSGLGTGKAGKDETNDSALQEL